MKCPDCLEKMELVHCYDSPDKGFAYNMYHCNNCMIYCKENVWKHKSELWIDPDNFTWLKSA